MAKEKQQLALISLPNGHCNLLFSKIKVHKGVILREI